MARSPLSNRQRFDPSVAFMSTFNLSLLLLAFRPVPGTLFSPSLPLNPAIPKAVASVPKIETAARDRLNPVKQTVETTRQNVDRQVRSTYHLPPREFEGRTIHRVELPSQRRVIALTFDDGPWPDTVPILDILRENEIRATFFMVGSHLQSFPEIARQVVKEGHVLGNHTWNHQYYPVNDYIASQEIDNTAASLNQQTGVYTRLFRPPGGNLTNGLANYAARGNYAVVMWSINPEDTYGGSAASLADRVISQAHPGGIVLLHDGGGNRAQTVAALPTIIAGLRDRGYEFVTVPEILAMELEEQQVPAKQPLTP